MHCFHRRAALVIPSPPGEGAAQRRMRDAKASGEMKPIIRPSARPRDPQAGSPGSPRSLQGIGMDTSSLLRKSLGGRV